MAASRMVIVAVAVMAAAGAGYVAKNMMAAPPPEPVAIAPPQPVVPTTDVLVLSGDVPMGQPLDANISWEKWPSPVPDGFITRDAEPEALDKLKGSVAKVSLYQGEPLRKTKLVGEGLSFMSSILPAGRRAVATQVNADTSAGGFILPNDFVDVIMTRRRTASQGQAEGFITETILKNIKVLAIDQAIQEDEEGKRTKVGETATLELTPQQAEIITVAQQMADRLTLALRSVADAQEVSSDQADYLVSGESGTNRGTIRMIKSGEVTEVGARK